MTPTTARDSEVGLPPEITSEDAKSSQESVKSNLAAIEWRQPAKNEPPIRTEMQMIVGYPHWGLNE